MKKEEIIKKKLPYFDGNKIRNTFHFSKAANYYRENGKYCPYGEAQKEFLDFWDAEAEKCLYGVTIGEVRITGYHYFFLNYCPMNIISDTATESVGEIDHGFPRFVLFQWQVFQIIEICEKTGFDLSMVKVRGCGLSEIASSMGARDFCLPQRGLPRSLKGKAVFKKVFYFASRETHLIGDGVLQKVFDKIEFVNQNTQKAFRQLSQTSNKAFERKAAKKDRYSGDIIQTGGFVKGIIVDKPDKAHPYSSNVLTNKGYKKWGDLLIDDKIYNEKGELKSIVEFHEFDEEDIYEIEFSDGRICHSTLNHEWKIQRWVTRKEKRVLEEQIVTTQRIIDLVNMSSYVTNKIKISKNFAIELPKQEIPFDAYTLGLMLGDGYMKRSTKNRTQIAMMSEDLKNISEFIPYTINYSKYDDIHHSISVPNAKNILQELNLLDKKSLTKFIPDIYKFNTKEIRLAVLNGLLDTDGSVTKDFGVIEYVSISKQLADDFVWIARSLGFLASVKFKKMNNPKHHDVYRCYIYCDTNCDCLFKLKRKSERISIKKDNAQSLQMSNYFSVKSVKFSHKEKARCITTEESTWNKSGAYLIEDFIPTLNCRGNRGYKLFFEESGDFGKLEKALNIALPLVKVGGKKFGTIIAWGTSNEEVSNIDGLKKCIYNPSAFNMLKFFNSWIDPLESEENLEKCVNYKLFPEDLIINSESSEPGVGWFVPVYMNMFLDKDGNPDVLRAIQYEGKERKKKLSGQQNSDALSYIGDHPFTIKEALVKGASKEFDSPKLINHYVNIINNIHVPYYERGSLEWEFAGKTKEVVGIKFLPNKEGNIWIHEHPKKDSFGNHFRSLYISGCDSINKGNDETITKNRSNLAMLVKKRIHPELAIQDTNNLYVAMYNYRSDDVEDDFASALKLAYYYGCNVNIEDSMTLIKNFFVRHNMGHRLIKKPMAVRKDVNSEKESNFVGTPATEAIIKHYVQRIKDYLQYYGDTLPFLVMIEQLKDWNYEEKGKFDLVAAMGMTEIFGEELDNKGIIATVSQEEEFKGNIGYFINSSGYKEFGVIPENTNNINMGKPQKVIRMIDMKQNRIIFAGEEDS